MHGSVPCAAAAFAPTSGILWSPTHRAGMLWNPAHRAGSSKLPVLDLFMTRPVAGEEPRRRKYKLRVREREKEGWKFEIPPQLKLQPYENAEGYIVDPLYLTFPQKLLAVTTAIVLVLAALHPPPIAQIPAQFSSQFSRAVAPGFSQGFLGNGHRDLVSTAAGQPKFWSDLTGKEKTAAELLGFDQRSWDEDGKVPVDKKTWQQLTPVQQRAAAVLSIDQALWDQEVFVDIYERSWNELKPVQKDAAKLLGFDQKTWDEEKHVWSDDLYFKQLTLAQQGAAMEIGYTAEEWDSTRKVFDKSWDKLTGEQQEAAKLLGWNVQKWEKDKYVRVDDLYWYQLNDTQRKAARLLGFKQQDWDKATKAGSHSKDMETQRKRQLRDQATKSNKGNDKGSGQCESNLLTQPLNQLLGPLGFKKCISKKQVPYYVPTILQRSHVGHTFPFGMGELK